MERSGIGASLKGCKTLEKSTGPRVAQCVDLSAGSEGV